METGSYQRPAWVQAKLDLSGPLRVVRTPYLAADRQTCQRGGVDGAGCLYLLNGLAGRTNLERRLVSTTNWGRMDAACAMLTQLELEESDPTALPAEAAQVSPAVEVSSWATAGPKLVFHGGQAICVELAKLLLRVEVVR